MFISVSRIDGSARRRGWTLIELLVVISIISILGVISVPILRSFARNDMRDGARTVYTMLRAARVYAMTHNVETAVVYELDSDFLMGTPMVDSLRSANKAAPYYVRAIRAAQVMYRLPDAVGLRPRPPDSVNANEDMVNWYSPQVGTFIPTNNASGQRVEFAQGYALLLEKTAPEYNPNAPPEQVYLAEREVEVNVIIPRDYDPTAQAYLAHYLRRLEEPKKRFPDGTGAGAGLEKLGIVPVYAYTGPLMDYSTEEISEAQPYVHPRMAHVFAPRGNLVSLQSAERYRLWFGPSPDAYYTERIWFIGDEPNDIMVEAWLNGIQPLLSNKGGNLIGIPIDIHRATGRVTMGSS